MDFGLSTRVDEDEGSLPRSRVNPDKKSGENRKISGSPLGLPFQYLSLQFNNPPTIL
jgi:hypothetical protein